MGCVINCLAFECLFMLVKILTRLLVIKTAERQKESLTLWGFFFVRLMQGNQQSMLQL